MSRSKYSHYAVTVGRVPGIYNNWPDAQAQVDGFSSGKVKGFYSLKDATEYFKNSPKGTLSSSPSKTSAPVPTGDRSTLPQRNYIFHLRNNNPIKADEILGYWGIESDEDIDDLSKKDASKIIKAFLEGSTRPKKKEEVEPIEETGSDVIASMEKSLRNIKRKLKGV